MFDLSKRKKVEDRFTRLEFTWYPTLLEIIPQWGNPKYLVQFHIHTQFLNNQQVESLVEILDRTFAEIWDNQLIQRVVALNDQTLEGAKFTQALLKSDLDLQYKFFLAISGALAVKHLGLKQALILLKSRQKQFGRIRFEVPLISDNDLTGKDLAILPGVEIQHWVFRKVSDAISDKEVSHFWRSEFGVQLSYFLAKSDVTYGEFFSTQRRQKKSSGKDLRTFSTKDLLKAFKIVEVSPSEKINHLTSSQLLSIAQEMKDDEIGVFTMDEILGRPRRTDVEQISSYDQTSLLMLRQFTADTELEVLLEDSISFNLDTRLAKIPDLFSKYGNFNALLDEGSAPILAVLAEVAVTKGVRRYLEVIEILDEFSSSENSWFTMDTDNKIELVNFIREVFDEDNDEINLKWLLQIKRAGMLK